MTRKSTIVVTDRRVFIAQGLASHEIGEYPIKAVRVLQYDTSGASLRVWLNVDGEQRGYRIWKGYRAATDAMVHALGDAPPSLTHTPDQ
jgi:hypothetical protein